VLLRTFKAVQSLEKLPGCQKRGVGHDGGGTSFQESRAVQGRLSQIAVLGDLLELLETIHAEEDIGGSRVIVFVVIQNASV
jgi:hypothetical protein